MGLIKTLEGNGTVTPADQKSIAVRYRLDVWQKEIPDGLGGTIPGMKSITGSIRPFCGSQLEKLTLRMEDGRTVDFFFTDGNGSVEATGGISK
jgi:hypothetical protein